MNIIARKLFFNEIGLHLINWKDKECFFVSEISAALDSASKDDISNFLRYGGLAAKGEDYDVVQGEEARELRSHLESSGIKKRFAQAMIIYLDGLIKYFDFRKTVEIKDFKSYLVKSKVIPQTSDEAIEEAVETSSKPLPKKNLKEKPSEDISKSAAKKDINRGYNGYSDFLKHINFMEEFVHAFNSINISSDKSVAFTKSMVKLLEDNGINPNVFLKELKKWMV